MADKEYLLGNRARELLKFTNQATKVVSDDISVKDVRAILHKIASLDDIQTVRSVCKDIDEHLAVKSKEGFSRAMYRCYGEEMRIVARNIVRDIHAANGKMFNTEYDERLRLINCVLDGCSLMLEYINTVLELGVISLKKSETWTKKVLDVKYMTASWKKNDGARANKLRAEEAAKQDFRQVEVVKTAIRQVQEEGRRRKEYEQRSKDALHPPPPGSV